MTNGRDGTVGDRLVAVLRLAGVAALYGEPIGGIDVVPVPDPALARLLAACHRRVAGTTALTTSGRTLERSGAYAQHLSLRTEDDLMVLAGLLYDRSGPAWTCELDIDLNAPSVRGVPIPPAGSVEEQSVAEASEALAVAGTVAVLAGPGVVESGAVAGLHALASAGAYGVLNTWGAKGVFDWRSRHHVATVGLQAQDFVLGGLAGADVIVATGLGDAEVPPSQWQLAPHVTVPPEALGALAERAPRSRVWPDLPPLRPLLAAVTQRGWDDNARPLAPSQVTRTYSRALGSVGRVVADAGTAGFWVARTFSTVTLGSVHVPAHRTSGFAAAAALVSRLQNPTRPVLAVCDGPVTDETTQILELADHLGAGFAVEAWTDDGDALDAAAHLVRSGRLATMTRSAIVTLRTASWQMQEIVDAAGPVTAWSDGS